MNLKKFVYYLILVVLSLSLVSCSSTTIDGEEVQRYAWPLGTASAEDTVTQIYAEKFADEVYRLSDGTMKIQVYPNSTLGGDRELLESCKSGDIPFIVQNTAPQVSFMPQLAVFDMPVLYTDIDDVRNAIDDEEFYSMIEDVYDQAGYKLLGYADQGFRVMSSNKMIDSIDDFKGVKIRTMENPYHIAFWKGLGANPTPMSFSEVYIGLQQGTIDAQENPYEVIASSKLYEQQDYIINTNHLPHLISLTVSKDFFEGLTTKQQDIIVEAADNAKEYAREQADLRTEDVITSLEATGTEIVDLSDEVFDEIREVSQPIYDDIEEVAGSELVEKYISLSGN